MTAAPPPDDDAPFPPLSQDPSRYRTARPPIDDTEYVDDLRRQDEAWVRNRTDEYFGLYGRAARSLSQPGSYRRGDLTTDLWTLWGMWVRDVVDVGLRSVRTLNQVAADTPVPTQPYRRATTKPGSIEVRSRGEHLHLRCSELVRTLPEGCEPTTIGPAEVEISPNPLLAGDPRTVTVAVNAAAPAGIYVGRLLVYGEHPEHPIEAVKVEIEVPPDFSRQ